MFDGNNEQDPLNVVIASPQSPARLKGAGTYAVNELTMKNNVTLNIPNISQVPQMHKQELVLPHPIKIEVDSPTDWTVAIIAPLLIAVAAAYFGWITQRGNIRSSIANFRNEWLKDLRAAIINYIGAAVEIHFRSVNAPGYFDSDDAIPLITKMNISRATVRAMLDVGKPNTPKMVRLMDDIVDIVGDTTNSNFELRMRDFVDLSQEVLESAWKDIKRDLYNKKKV